MVRAFPKFRSERKKWTTSGGCPQFPKRFSGKLPFHLTSNRNFRIFWLNGKHPKNFAKVEPHVQHDYISSFNQSDHCFLALSLPLPTSLLKPSNESKQQRRQPQQRQCQKKKWSDWINEETQSCCTCGTHFSSILWRSLPNNNVKFPNLRF